MAEQYPILKVIFSDGIEAEYAGHEGQVLHYGVCDDTRYVISEDYINVHVWDSVSGKILQKHQTYGDFHFPYISSDGNWLAMTHVTDTGHQCDEIVNIFYIGKSSISSVDGHGEICSYGHSGIGLWFEYEDGKTYIHSYGEQTMDGNSISCKYELNIQDGQVHLTRVKTYTSGIDLTNRDGDNTLTLIELS